MYKTFFFFSKNSKQASTLLLFSLLLTFNACRQEKTLPDISNINVDLEINRFEQDLFQTDTTQKIKGAFDPLASKYIDFYPVFTKQLMQFEHKQADSIATIEAGLMDFIKNKDMRQLYDSVQYFYPNIDPLKAEFETAFRYYKYYFPDKNPPKIITHLSVFGPAAVTVDSLLLGVNLDMYLGREFPFYASSNIPSYLSQRFEPQYITPNSLKAHFRAIYPTNERKGKLIDQMVYQGKLLYLLDLVLPETADSLKIGYTQMQLDWCARYEAKIWAFFVEKDLLFESGHRQYYKFINEGPTTAGMPPESPGNIGAWVGWQIIKKLMADYPKMTLEELMNKKDGQQILTMTRYKPRESR